MHVALADQGSDKAIRARLLLGEILQRLGRSSEAEPQFASALAAAETISPKATALVARIKADLACATSRCTTALSQVSSTQRLPWQ